MARDGKPGRDPLDKQSKTIAISIKLPERLLEDVDAFFGPRKRSEAIRDALVRHLAFERKQRAKQAAANNPPLGEKEE